jgi:hypothetical protein
MRVLNLTAGFGLIQVGTKMFKVIIWRQQASINDEKRNYEDACLLAMWRF